MIKYRIFDSLRNDGVIEQDAETGTLHEIVNNSVVATAPVSRPANFHRIAGLAGAYLSSVDDKGRRVIESPAPAIEI